MQLVRMVRLPGPHDPSSPDNPDYPGSPGGSMSCVVQMARIVEVILLVRVIPAGPTFPVGPGCPDCPGGPNRPGVAVSPGMVRLVRRLVRDLKATRCPRSRMPGARRGLRVRPFLDVLPLPRRGALVRGHGSNLLGPAAPGPRVALPRRRPSARRTQEVLLDRTSRAVRVSSTARIPAVARWTATTYSRLWDKAEYAGGSWHTACSRSVESARAATREPGVLLSPWLNPSWTRLLRCHCLVQCSRC